MTGWRDEVPGIRKNAGQWKAFESKGNCVVLAGPGSGKTRTIVMKVARLVAETITEPHRVAVLTYSHACVNEVRRRLSTLHLDDESRVLVSTVHGFCLVELIMPFAKLAGVAVPEPLVVATDAQRSRHFGEAVAEVLGHGTDYKFRTCCDVVRMAVQDRASRTWKEDNRAERKVVDAFERRMARAGLIDFDGMVLAGVELIDKHEWVRSIIRARFPILVVDEYQDLGVPLHRMVLTLMQRAGVRVVAVGDPDQSIYGFVGARPELLRELAELREVEKVELKLNYRCAPAIAGVSQAVLAGGDAQHDGEGVVFIHETGKSLSKQAAIAAGKLIPELLESNPDWAIGDIAVLYRTRYEGEAIAQQMKSAGLPFFRADRGSPVARTRLLEWAVDAARWCTDGVGDSDVTVRALTRDLFRILRLSRQEAPALAVQLGLAHFLFKGKDPAMPLRTWLAGMEKCFLRQAFGADATLSEEAAQFRDLRGQAEMGRSLGHLTVGTFSSHGRDPGRLFLTTLYSAKGLEFNAVIMPGLEHGQVPRTDDDAEQQAEARRLFYVGLTRARHQVHLMYARTPSVFVKAVQASLVDTD